MRRLLLVLALLTAVVPAGAQSPSPAPAGSPAVVAPAAPSLPAAAPIDAPEIARPVATAVAPAGHDLSPVSMFLGADALVKAVMIGLALASLVTWTIFIGKLAELALMKRRLRDALHRLGECRSLAEAENRLGDGRDALATLIRDTAEEVRLSAGITGEAGLKERVQSLSADLLRVEGRAVRRGLGMLATIGSISPFVGLFGTVWGIMNSFIGIAKSNTTNLAVVAPGIAEALLATAIGLVAAIPAVIIYNHFARSTKGYLDLVTRASGAVARLLSRDLDRFRTRGGGYAQAAE